MTVFDAHCHVFNGSILEDAVPSEDLKVGRDGLAPGSVGSWWSWMKETAKVLVASEGDNNQFIYDRLQANMTGADEYATIPLMMDIRYFFGHSLQMGQTIPTGTLSFETGLQKQIDALQVLSAAGNCYPFFAVDPRRPGVIEAILDGQYVTRKPGGFYGIKLYPRLGYHPMAGRLPELYSYCAKNDIPITTHCSTGGFPPWKTENGEFCNPENYRSALELNPGLRIDIAHWGYGSYQWSGTILNLMRTYTNVYSDLSCYTGQDDLINFKIPIWAYPLARQRTMYGSDFDVFYFTKTDLDMDQYVQSFKVQFNQDELNVMMSQLPTVFLGL